MSVRLFSGIIQLIGIHPISIPSGLPPFAHELMEEYEVVRWSFAAQTAWTQARAVYE